MKPKHYQDIYNYEKTHWWYKTRRKIVNDLIIKYFPEKPPKKILDIGCGAGALLSELKKNSECFGIDKSPLAIKFCRKRSLNNIKYGDATNIPYEDHKFDLVLALDIIEHVQNDDQAIGEIKRVLRPDGKAIIFVPVFNFLWSKTDEISNHYRRYHLKDLESKA
ncbi:class I SAM-dependent methyltransferase, partial [Patescibacteria group bacterium]